MNSDKFMDLIVARKYEEVFSAISGGFDVDTPLGALGKCTALELAALSRDHKMVSILLKAGAKTKPQFEHIIHELEPEKVVESKNDFSNAKDLTNNFRINKLKLLKGKLIFEENSYSLEIPVEPFLLNDELIETKILIDDLTFPRPLVKMEEKVLNYPLNPDEGYIDASIYLNHVHNPIDIPKIEVLKVDNNHVELKVNFIFDFEYEGSGFKNETLETVIEAILS